MCEICRSYPCRPRCPNYIPPKASHYCSICNKGIYDGEEYIINDNYEYAHLDCLSYGRDMAEFLGYGTSIMEVYDETFY